MNAVLQGLSGIFEVFLIVALGFFLKKSGWIWDGAAGHLTKMTMTVALPPLMIYSLYSNFTHEELIRTAPDMILPFVSIFVAYLAGLALAKVIRIRKGRRGIFITTCCIANAIFVGLPVNVALFGETSVPSCMLYYIANTTMFWCLGAWLIIKDAEAEMKMTVKDFLKKLLSPPLLGFLTGVLLLVLNIPLPKFFLDSCRYVGNMATPLALLVIGLQMADIPLSDIRFDRDLAGALAGRFLLCPVCLYFLLPLIPVSPMSAKVFLMQSGMPAMTNMTILAASVGADAKYSTTINCVSMVLGLFFIPFYMVLLS